MNSYKTENLKFICIMYSQLGIFIIATILCVINNETKRNDLGKFFHKAT